MVAFFLGGSAPLAITAIKTVVMQLRMPDEPLLEHFLPV